MSAAVWNVPVLVRDVRAEETVPLRESGRGKSAGLGLEGPGMERDSRAEAAIRAAADSDRDGPSSEPDGRDSHSASALGSVDVDVDGASPSVLAVYAPAGCVRFFHHDAGRWRC